MDLKADRAKRGGTGAGSWRILIAAAFTAMAAACGGGGGGSSGGGGGSTGPNPPPPPVRLSAPETARFLTQATFGPTDTGIEALRDSSYDAWITQQIATPAPTATHQATVEAALAAAIAANPNATINGNNFYYSWWRQAVTEDGQLRQRMAFALSQIFVVSLVDGAISGSSNGIRGAASYYDMLTRNAFANYRTLLEEITLHPVMGTYLTFLGNQREDAAGTRTPDENYAREVLQLMSIGLFELNLDGSNRLNAQGQPIPAYSQQDISQLARVFTGISWYHPSPTNNTFFGRNRDPDSFVRPMIFYPQYHSFSAKTFLGASIPARTAATVTQQTMADDLRVALDTLANHPNVGPFMATRLIQQFVTSNPSPAYVERVARVFNNNGQGVRGDLGAVIRAVLTDPEARTAPTSDSFGKLREPVIRTTNWARAFGASSASGNWLIGNTSSNQSLGQTPLASPSVFNFWRPGFVPAGTTQLGSRGLRAPEFQIVDEVSVAGFINTMQNTVQNGIGVASGGVPDVRSTYGAETAIAENADALVDRMNRLLFYGAMPANTRTRILEAVNSIPIPSGATVTQAQIDTARLNRVRTAIQLSLASPDFLVQR